MTTPTDFYRQTEVRQPPKIHNGADAVVNGWAGSYRRRSGALAVIRRQAGEVMDLEGSFKTLTDHHLHEKLLEYRGSIRRGGRGAENILLQALAAIRETAHRQLGLSAFPEQIMGVLAMHDGCLAEMATGEGKTLTAGLTGVLMAWSGRPCHIITVNDYLVQRDANWLGPLYRFCSVRVGHVTASMPPEERRKAYSCDLTYTTSKEVVADFLRDCIRVGEFRNPTRRLIRQMARPVSEAQEGLVLRGLHTAIVDEADSILIDEAVTPLILSAPRPNDALREVVQAAQKIAEPLQEGAHYTVNRRHREIEITSEGNTRLDELVGTLPGFWRGEERRSELIKQALAAREFYTPGRQYVVVDGKIVIVDEFTGRQMAQRTWRQGMHQAIEAKEGLKITDPNETIARISFQRYFRLYHRLSGMTGTAAESAQELWQVYRLPVMVIPTHRPCVRVQHPDIILPDADSRWDAVVDEVKRVHATGQPILIGTRSVTASERLAKRLEQNGFDFRLLNAVRHLEEATVVAMAGERGRITIATNMAGRGTDIRLGLGVAQLGGLHVIATERHESERVDRQLFGRSARQGDPGSAVAILSVEDELFLRHLPGTVQRQIQRAVASGIPGWRTLARAARVLAQRNAQSQASKMRASVMRLDDWMEGALSFTGAKEG